MPGEAYALICTFLWALSSAMLIAAGAYLVAAWAEPHRDLGSKDGRDHLLGVALALATAVCWASSTTLLRLGGEGLAAEVVNAVRLSVLLGVLAAMLVQRGDMRRLARYERRTFSFAMLAGVIGPGGIHVCDHRAARGRGQDQHLDGGNPPLWCAFESAAQRKALFPHPGGDGPDRSRGVADCALICAAQRRTSARSSGVLHDWRRF